MTIWITGLPAAGKTTLARALAEKLGGVVIDGDEIRLPGQGFSRLDRDGNVYHAAYLAQQAEKEGKATVCSLISPYRETRDKVRGMFENFIEVYLATPLEVCEARDPKGLYAKARKGGIENFTGISDPYEPPLRPEVVLTEGSVEEHVSIVIGAISRMFPRGASATVSQGVGA